MSSISEAHMFAAGAHGGVGQKRKYTGEDYINHPVDGLSGEYAEKSLEEWAEQIRKGADK